MARRSQISGRLLASSTRTSTAARVGRSRPLAGAALALLLRACRSAARRSSRPAATTRPGELGARALTPQATPAEVGPDVDLERIGRELRARKRDYAAALARRDLEALAGFYTRMLQVAAPSLPDRRRRGGVRSLLQHLVDAGVSGVELGAAELYPVGELVCETGRRAYAGAPARRRRDRYMTLWKNEDGTWRIHRDLGGVMRVRRGEADRSRVSGQEER